jgi:adenylylsulfate kinase-like enzyme
VKPLLFCRGIPGAGKSVIASTVVNQLHKMVTHDAAVTEAFVYFSDKRRHKQTAAGVSAALLAAG